MGNANKKLAPATQARLAAQGGSASSPQGATVGGTARPSPVDNVSGTGSTDVQSSPVSGQASPGSDPAGSGSSSAGASGTGQDASSGSQDGSGGALDAPGKLPTLAEAKAAWKGAQTRLDAARKEVDEAGAAVSAALKGLQAALGGGSQFKENGQILTISQRGGTYFVKGRSQKDEVPDLDGV